MESRNYRFTFRASLQKVINEIKEPVDLVTLRNKFIDYWKTHSDPNGDNHLEAYFYRFFPSDRAGEAQVEDFRNPSNNSFSKDFENEFDNRLFWEIISELGYNAAIGRTLEKTGSSAPSFNSGKLKEAFITTSPWMAANMMDSVDEDSFVKFLNGLLHRTRFKKLCL